MLGTGAAWVLCLVVLLLLHVVVASAAKYTRVALLDRG